MQIKKNIFEDIPDKSYQNGSNDLNTLLHVDLFLSVELKNFK